MTLLRVEGYSNLRKDKTTGGVINVDREAYLAHKQARQMALQQMEEKKLLKDSVSSLEGEINNMKNELTDIKSMLVQLLNKGQ